MGEPTSYLPTPVVLFPTVVAATALGHGAASGGVRTQTFDAEVGSTLPRLAQLPFVLACRGLQERRAFAPGGRRGRGRRRPGGRGAAVVAAPAAVLRGGGGGGVEAAGQVSDRGEPGHGEIQRTLVNLLTDLLLDVRGKVSIQTSPLLLLLH